MNARSSGYKLRRPHLGNLRQVAIRLIETRKIFFFTKIQRDEGLGAFSQGEEAQEFDKKLSNKFLFTYQYLKQSFDASNADQTKKE